MAQVMEFEEGRPRRERDEGEAALVIDVDGYEGPLDLLLDLARRQKVDLTKISILALAEQYLVFIEEARKLRLELAADYLVMAAWLAYLKSRLLLPDPPKGEEPSAADLATALALRLKRLEVIRAAATLLADRPRLGREIFARGAPEPVEIHHRPIWEANLFDLLSAYGQQRQKQAASHITMKRREVWSLSQAREALERLLGHSVEWISLDQYLLKYVTEPAQRATVIASALSATLEMVREGKLALRQEEAFGSLWIKPSIREEVAS
jgi:segregation and condensation protein A